MLALYGDISKIIWISARLQSILAGLKFLHHFSQLKVFRFLVVRMCGEYICPQLLDTNPILHAHLDANQMLLRRKITTPAKASV